MNGHVVNIMPPFSQTGDRGIKIQLIQYGLYMAYIVQLIQYGFKKNSSCSHVLFTVSESVRYFTKNGSRVYCAFLDAGKAFDKVLHNGIYKKLLDRGAPVTFVHLLKNWYDNLRCRVRWMGESFAVKRGVRQGGVLSPYLFAIYTLWFKKNARTLEDYNYDPVQSILIIFSKLFVNDHKSCLVVKLSTSPHMCCHYTL